MVIIFFLKVWASTEHLHTVIDGAKWFTVCLNTWMCSCERFQHDKLSCSHVVTAIEYRNKYVESFCSIYYGSKNFRDTYAIPIELLSYESTWIILKHVSDELVLPPNTKKGPRRSSNRDRKKGFNELKCKQVKGIYSLCGVEGHNKKNCPEIPPSDWVCLLS